MALRDVAGVVLHTTNTTQLRFRSKFRQTDRKKTGQKYTVVTIDESNQSQSNKQAKQICRRQSATETV